MKKILSVVVVLFLSVTGFAFAEGKTDIQKIAVVHVQRILQDSPKVADVNKKLQDEFQPRQEALSELQKKVQDEVADLNKNASIMDDSDKTQAQEKIAKERQDFLDKANALQQDFNKAQTEFMKQIFEDLNGVITKLAKQDGYSVILDSQAVAFADPSLDITNDVLAAFNDS